MKDEYRGYWWLPGKPDSKVHGTLHLSELHASLLELDGALIELKHGEHVDFKPDIILGQAIEGTRLTLYKCTQTKASRNSTGVKASELLVQITFVGTHFERPEDIQFKYVAVEFGRLKEWLRLPTVDVKWDGSSTIVTYTRPPPIISSLKELKLKIGINESHRYDFIEGPSIRQDSYFGIETESPTSLQKFQELIYHFQNFLSLALGDATRPQSITGYSDMNTIEIGGEKIREPIEIVYRYATAQVAETESFMLFNYSEIANRLDDVLGNWLAKANMLEPVLFGYFGPLYHPEMYLEQKFLAYAQAIESYHRRVFDGPGIPPEIYSKIIPEIMAIAPKEHNDWFDSKLGYNEPSLRQRLKALLKKIDWIDFGGSEFMAKLSTHGITTHITMKS